ncbi:MAG: septal ring lytic transglycosylase RlpA family protein, partial [Candidatus Latescibacteria bacterium]|nr:septal ring lytic transglycosylase RlpA family protein [Candidatus Latescibacterota bacterium]
GEASYYADKFHGRKTANGEIFNMHAMTAAHRKLSFDTKLRVTNLANGMSVVVRINDRGPFVKGRIIDLSYGAAKKIGLVQSGVAKVKLEIVK